MANEISEAENKEQGFIPFGGKLAVLDDCCLVSPKEYERQIEASEKLIELWNSLDSAPITIKPIVLRGDKND